MSNLNDFMSFHPTPKPPNPEPVADPGRDAFMEETVPRATKTPTRGRGSSMLLVSREVCRVGCTKHDHGVGPIFKPDPELDESMVGWTTQHMPHDPSRGKVPHRCVLCWSLEENLVLHDCTVLMVVNG